ncbi:MAG: NAD-dependent epimerase/dehydratase family protein [Bythopirellula sp.]|nr:NAD-dependent epimerase/dehydratase family protein [Bythopirellula sp.]
MSDQPCKLRTIGITGPHGFVAGHLARTLSVRQDIKVLPCPRAAFDDESELAKFVALCDVIVHLAGLNRGDDAQVYITNVALANKLIAAADKVMHPLHIVFASSTQRDRDNSYGRSKKYGEMQFAAWARRGMDRQATNLIIPNVFGPGCRPFYNSVVATFCHQIARGHEPRIEVDNEVEFIWVNDLVKRICEQIDNHSEGPQEVRLFGTAKLRVSELLAKLRNFRESHVAHDMVPDISEPLDAALYATYLSHLDLEQHVHRPQVHRDERGSLFEIIRMAGGGQVFFSTTKPGVIRGNHFHTRKIEWFCVLKGEAAIRLRKVDDTEVHEFRVSGEAPQFVSIPVLHTHQIENVGQDELLTMFWCNEIFVPEDADTYFEKVA